MAVTWNMRLGAAGEKAAADFLSARGWLVRDRNWRHGSMELDLVCQQGETVVFVEVKTRKTGGLTGPEDAFGPEKKRRLINAARTWLAAHQAWSSPCRFDLVLVTRTENTFQMELVSDVIQLAAGNAVSGGHTHWQPW